MRIKTVIKSFIISSLFFYVVLIAGKVYSETFDISGNASGSNNSIDINQSNPNTVNQSNSANVNNNANANSDTGGNSINNGVGEGSIKTGKATTNVNINNQFNSNVIKTNPTPTPKPSSTPTPKLGGPTSSPTTAPSGNGGNGGNGDGGAGGASTTADPGRGGAVLGLSATSGETSLLKLIPGLASILFGVSLITRRAKA